MRLMIRIVLVLSAVGCVRAEVKPLDNAVRPARPPESIAVLNEPPQRAYTVIATVEARGETVFDSFDQLRRKLIEEAAKLGGDAVILGSEETPSTLIITPMALINSERKELNAQVIVFKEPSHNGIKVVVL